MESRQIALAVKINVCIAAQSSMAPPVSRTPHRNPS
jgi:hypothetical protein